MYGIASPGDEVTTLLSTSAPFFSVAGSMIDRILAEQVEAALLGIKEVADLTGLTSKGERFFIDVGIVSASITYQWSSWTALLGRRGPSIPQDVWQ
jgi:hypothetical protein